MKNDSSEKTDRQVLEGSQRFQQERRREGKKQEIRYRAYQARDVQPSYVKQMKGSQLGSFEVEPGFGREIRAIAARRREGLLAPIHLVTTGKSLVKKHATLPLREN